MLCCCCWCCCCCRCCVAVDVVLLLLSMLCCCWRCVVVVVDVVLLLMSMLCCGCCPFGLCFQSTEFILKKISFVKVTDSITSSGFSVVRLISVVRNATLNLCTSDWFLFRHSTLNCFIGTGSPSAGNIPSVGLSFCTKIVACVMTTEY